MTDQTTQGSTSQQASGQSSSSSTAQSQSGQTGQGAQGDASGQGQQATQGQQGQQTHQGNGQSFPQRPAYVLESEWDGSKIREDVFGQRISDLAAFKAEQDVKANARPQSPDKYEVKLPANFELPAGVTFEFDPNSADLKRARELAHARGIDQESFSDFLGVYAATKIGEQQQLAFARDAERAKLGSAADNRISAIDTWLHARVGNKADTIVNQLKNFPHAGMVEMFEDLVRLYSNQGAANYSQGGRQQPDNGGKIEGFETMSFAQKRAAQDALNGRVIQPTGRVAAGGR